MNLFKRFERLIPSHPLRIGVVTGVRGTDVFLTEVGGGDVVVRGEAAVGQRVYFRNSAIEGLAPDLPVEAIEE